MILYPLIISIKIDELSNSTLGVKIISRVKSREHTRDLKGLVKFIYSVKATKFFEIFTLLLTVCTVVESKGKILQNFEAFSEYMNFKGFLSPPYYVFGNLSVLLIYSEVLA